MAPLPLTVVAEHVMFSPTVTGVMVVASIITDYATSD